MLRTFPIQETVIPGMIAPGSSFFNHFRKSSRGSLSSEVDRRTPYIMDPRSQKKGPVPYLRGTISTTLGRVKYRKIKFLHHPMMILVQLQRTRSRREGPFMRNPLLQNGR